MQMKPVPEEKVLTSMLNGVDIPPCPAVLLELDAELRKEEPDQREVARRIGQDVALSGHVMLAVNLFGMLSMFQVFVGHLLRVALADNQNLTMERFWESSLLTARVSAELARRLGGVRPDMAYTFGLFHDCGIPVLARRFPQTKDVLAKANVAEYGLFTDIEDELLGTNHAVVGYFLARRWQLPVFIAEGILYHHDYSVLSKPGMVHELASTLIAICVLAEHIIRLHCRGDEEEEWGKAAPAACAYFNLSLAAVDDLIEDIRDWLG